MAGKPKYPIGIPELAYIISRYRMEMQESGGASGKIKSWSDTWPPCFPSRTWDTLRNQTSSYITNENPTTAQVAKRQKAEQHIQDVGGEYSVIQRAEGNGYRPVESTPSTTMLPASAAIESVYDLYGGLTMTLRPTSVNVNGTACIDIDEMAAEDALMQLFKGGTIALSVQTAPKMARVIGRLKSKAADEVISRRLEWFGDQLLGALPAVPLDTSNKEQYVGEFGVVVPVNRRKTLEDQVRDARRETKDKALLRELRDDRFVDLKSRNAVMKELIDEHKKEMLDAWLTEYLRRKTADS